jgi:hypothetical protein
MFLSFAFRSHSLTKVEKRMNGELQKDWQRFLSAAKINGFSVFSGFNVPFSQVQRAVGR